MLALLRAACVGLRQQQHVEQLGTNLHLAWLESQRRGSANPVFIADTDFATFDPVRQAFGQQISPEGNGHQAEFTRDNKFMIATE